MNTPFLSLYLKNVGPGVLLDASISGDLTGVVKRDSLEGIELKVVGDTVWDVDYSSLPDKVIAIELEGGETDRSVDLTKRILKALSGVDGSFLLQI